MEDVKCGKWNKRVADYAFGVAEGGAVDGETRPRREGPAPEASPLPRILAAPWGHGTQSREEETRT